MLVGIISQLQIYSWVMTTVYKSLAPSSCERCTDIVVEVQLSSHSLVASH